MLNISNSPSGMLRLARIIFSVNLLSIYREIFYTINLSCLLHIFRIPRTELLLMWYQHSSVPFKEVVEACTYTFQIQRMQLITICYYIWLCFTSEQNKTLISFWHLNNFENDFITHKQPGPRLTFYLIENFA